MGSPRGCGMLACALLLGCAATDERPTASEPASMGSIAALVTGATSSAPIAARGDVAAVLRMLAPVPSGAVVIVYDITGPAGIAGTLEVLIAEGGYRRENWQVRVPLPDRTAELRGSRVRTPEQVWHGDGDGPGTAAPAELGTIARAIAALDDEARARVLGEVQRWRGELERARTEDGTATRTTIAGIECTQVRAGAGEVCTWEALGVLLRYDSAAFQVLARHVEHGAELGPHAFEIPASAVAAATMTPADRLAPRLAAIAAGDRAQLLRLLHVDAEPLPALSPAG